MDGGRLLLAIAVAGGLLFILEFCRAIIQKYLARALSLERTIETQFFPTFMVNFVFVVMLPAIVYAALYPMLPFGSYRSGIFIALFVFGVGLLPQQIRNHGRHRLSTALTAFELFWNLLTLLLVLGSITYLYHY